MNKLVRVARTQQHNVGVVATILMLVLIARLTLYPSPGPLPSGFKTCVLCGTYGLADFIDNVILFVPLGFALRLTGLRRRTAWLITLGMAIGIETAQDWVVSGRESGLTDLISNPLGGAIGIALTDGRRLLIAPGATAATRLTRAATMALLAFTVCLTWCLRLSIPRTGAYWTQVRSELHQFVPFDGEILSATIDGRPVRNGRVDDAPIRSGLRNSTIRLGANVIPHASSDRLAPLITVFDQWQNEILVLGCRRGRVVFRARTRTQILRVHPVSFETADGCTVGDTSTIAVEPLARGARVQLGAVTIGTGVWLGWRLLVPDDGWWSDLAPEFTILWMAMLLAPLAYWAARADRERGVGRASRALTWIAAVLALTLLAIPLIAGSTPAPMSAWLGAITGAAVGWILAQWDRSTITL